MYTTGQKPALPLPYEQPKQIGRTFVTLKERHYIIDVYPYQNYSGDGELVWTAYKWDGRKWPKIPCFTRAEENRFPKTIARLASYFLEECKQLAKIAV